MPLAYIRQDADLTIRTVSGDLEFELRVEDAVHPFKTGATLLHSVTELVSALMGWTPLLGAVNRSGTGVMLPRQVVHAHEPRLAAVEWEDVLGRLRLPAAVPAKLVVMRGTEALARSLSRRFDFPARVLEVGAPARVVAIARQLVRGASRNCAFLVRKTPLLASERTVASLRWPSVDILHVHATASCHARHRSQQTAPGGLEWLSRLADRWQVRLVVIEALPADASALRQAAQRLVDRGGPAVFVLASSMANTFTLYSSLLHDRPLDWCQQRLSKSAFFGGGGRSEAVRFSHIGLEFSSPKIRNALRKWVAVGREPATHAITRVPLRSEVVTRVIREVGQDLRLTRRHYIQLRSESLRDSQRLVRFNDIVSTRLMDYGYALPGFDRTLPRSYRGKSVPISSIASYVMRRAVRVHPSAGRKRAMMLDSLVTDRLDRLDRLMRVSVFEDSESEGTLPLATTTTEFRKLMLMSAAKPVKRSTPSRRHVTVEFYSWSESGPPRLIPQNAARLNPGAIVHLGIKIGALSRTTFSVGPMVFADEAIDWAKEKKGVWLEVGVTGIDMDVLGDPVQPVWLPAIGETTLATFAVRPRSETQIPGVARVRVTLFYRNNVVQSFLMAAALTTCDGGVEAALAAALSIEPPAVSDGAGYIARQEYSAVDPNGVSSLAERGLGIVANESAGQKIFSIKGQDFFSWTVNENVRNHVNALRAALSEASHGKLPEEYRYDGNNTGRESELFDLLWSLASRGWELWSLLVPSDNDQQVIQKLLGQGAVVTAAHVNISEVVPWSLIYDRKVDGTGKYSPDWSAAKPTVYDVERALCPATLPAADGSMPAVECGAEPKCLLHKSSIAARQAAGKMLLPESVICPRHFWGFTHQIEVPVQQVSTVQPKAVAQPVPAVQEFVHATAPIRVVAGFNGNVNLAGDHRERIAKVAADAQATFTAPTAAPKDAFIQSLEQQQPDIVYVYCHAWPDTLKEPKVPHPNLDFDMRLDNDIAFPASFSGAPWKHRPLVFLNGCGTVGFTPAAPGEFITKFIQGRLASAVIGTEVTVWAELADEVGWKFCEAFLGGKEAGATLLAIRRQLLHKNNPLGLVYTLYGSAGLHLVKAAPKLNVLT